MSVIPYTESRMLQYRGPGSSEEHNLRGEQNYKDLVYLYNKIAQISSDSDYAYTSIAKQIYSIGEYLDSIEDRIAALEEAESNLVFYGSSQVDTDRFNGSAFEVQSADRLSFSEPYNLLTLPLVPGSSVSKVRFLNDDGSLSVSTGLETVVIPVTPSADDTDAVIETSQPYDAIRSKPGRVWERNATTAATDANGAQCYLYIRIPNELSITSKSNVVMLTPYPIFDVDILDISYSTNTNVKLSDSASWTALNSTALYDSNSDAIGYVPPGGWAGDAIVDSGAKAFYFDPAVVTAIRIKFRQTSYYVNGSEYTYSYGLSNLDIRYDKFLSTGKAIIKLDAPDGETISAVDSVTPKAYNISQSDLDDAFEYRVLWETAFDSGVYTTTPVALSSRIWLEVTLNEVRSGYTPAISSILVNYS